jgi:hypothetical protein
MLTKWSPFDQARVAPVLEGVEVSYERGTPVHKAQMFGEVNRPRFADRMRGATVRNSQHHNFGDNPCVNQPYDQN